MRRGSADSASASKRSCARDPARANAHAVLAMFCELNARADRIAARARIAKVGSAK